MTFLDEIKQNFNEENFYKILSISSDADQSTIRRAYLSSSLNHHPDKVDDSRRDEYKRKFQSLTKIYTILSDPSARQDYDKLLALQALDREEPSNCDEVYLENCDKLDNHFAYNCRCSGSFILSRGEIDQQSNTDAFIVNCDSCSCSIKIIIK